MSSVHACQKDDGEWAQGRSSHDAPYRVYVWKKPMPRLSDEFLNCAIFVYPSKQAARKGESLGGSGFLAGVASEEQPFHYAVTNYHVIEEQYGSGKPVGLRFTGIKREVYKALPGASKITYLPSVMSIPAASWVVDKETDLAVCPVDLSMDDYSFSVIPCEYFMDDTILGTRMIGVGDEVFMVGRFVTREGEQRNTPTARFGSIAQMPDEPIRYGNFQHKSFLVECRFIGGFSGSPVFVWLLPGDARRREKESLMDASVNGPWLLGIECCYIPDWDYGYKISDYKTAVSKKWQVRSNTGLSGVIPAWKLAELLNSQELTMKRKKSDDEEKSRREAKSSGILTSRSATAAFTKDDL